MHTDASMVLNMTTAKQYYTWIQWLELGGVCQAKHLFKDIDKLQ